MEEINNIRKRRKTPKFLNMTLNFICTLVIAFVVYVCAGLLMTAERQAQARSGNDIALFSYSVIGSGRAELTAFGESFLIDFNRIAEIRERAGEIIVFSDNFKPGIISMSGSVIMQCFSSVVDELSRIPEIVTRIIEDW